jgi:hypothetical protein
MKLQELHSITRTVNNKVTQGCQFQGIRTLGDSQKRYILELRFYPSLIEGQEQALWIGLEGNAEVPSVAWIAKNDLKSLKSSAELSHKPTPVETFLKAHFLNLRVQKLESGSLNKLEFHFLESQLKLVFDWSEGSGVLYVESPNSQPRAFRNRLLLSDLSAILKMNPTSTESELVEKTAEPQSKKWVKLIGNIKSDKLQAESELALWEPAALQMAAFKSETRLESLLEQNEPLKKSFYENIHKSKLSHKSLVESVFKHIKKMRKRILGAEKRLEILEAEGPQRYYKKKPQEPKIQETIENTHESEKPQKKPGIWVLLKNSQVWARVGRSSSENAELFRQAGPRDLWFHIKSFPGGHVWIPRGQKHFGAKADPTNTLIQEGAMLALFNSKTNRGPRDSGEVEYTERLNLKALKGAANQGRLLVQRSQVIFVKAQ